jgi:hypothetical protein
MPIQSKQDLINYFQSFKDDYDGTPEQFVNALCEFITNAIEVKFDTGDVDGTCPQGGGPLTLGRAEDGYLEIT